MSANRCSPYCAMRVKRSRLVFLLRFLTAALAIVLAGCMFRRPIDAHRYAAWASTHSDQITAYQEFLDENTVGDIVPLPQLLRSARDWRKCHAEPFTMPPKELWPNLVSTLLVVRKFGSSGLSVGGFRPF